MCIRDRSYTPLEQKSFIYFPMFVANKTLAKRCKLVVAAVVIDAGCQYTQLKRHKTRAQRLYQPAGSLAASEFNRSTQQTTTLSTDWDAAGVINGCISQRSRAANEINTTNTLSMAMATEVLFFRAV